MARSRRRKPAPSSKAQLISYVANSEHTSNLGLLSENYFTQPNLKSRIGKILKDTRRTEELFQKNGNRNVLHNLLRKALDTEESVQVLASILRRAQLLNRLDEIAGPEVKQKTASGPGFHPIHEALSADLKPLLLETLLEYTKGFNLEEVIDSCGDTPLHFIARVSNEMENETDNTDTKKAKRCIEILFKDLSPEKRHELVNKGNKRFLTPIHYAITANNKDVVEYLLPFYEEIVHAGVKANHQIPLLHHTCLHDCNNEIRLEILELIIKRVQIIENDTKSDILNDIFNDETPLHAAVRNRQKSAVMKLIENPKIKLTIKDSKRRTCISHAAEKDGNDCIVALLSPRTRLPGKPKPSVAELFSDQDIYRKTVFDYAESHCEEETVNQFLDILDDTWGQHKIGMQWNKITSVPTVMKYMLDKSCIYDIHDKLLCEISFITGNYNPDTFVNETDNINESMHSWTYEQRKLVLDHVILKQFVSMKYRKVEYFVMLILFVQSLWTFGLFFFISLLTKISPSNKNEGFWIIAPLLCYVILSLVYEGVELCVRVWPNRYLCNSTNLAQLSRDILLLAAFYEYYFNKRDLDECKSFASVGILLAVPLAMRHFRNVHRQIGHSIDILRQVVTQVASVFASCFLILLGFTYAFQLLFDNNYNDSAPDLTFHNLTLVASFYKLMVLMAGNIDLYSGRNQTQEYLPDNLPTFVFGASRHITSFLFLMVIVFAFYNQLTGVALDKVKVLNERAKVQRIMSKIEYINCIEVFLHGCHKLLNCCWKGATNFFHRFDVGSNNSSGNWWDYSFCSYVPIEKEDNVVKDTVLNWIYWTGKNFPDLDRLQNADYKEIQTMGQKNVYKSERYKRRQTSEISMGNNHVVLQMAD